ncbi:MAG: hypothetical protein RLZZ519_1651, partial [Bacteroidota bacterium]
MVRQNFRPILGFLLLVLVQRTGLLAQVTNLSGTINTYLDVTAVNTVANTVTLSSVTGLAVGDTVFIIQMKGAAINTADGPTFGNISSINAAGKFEFNIVCNIVGNEVTLERLMLNTYNPSGAVQLIPVNVYANAAITGPVTPQAWDGNLGGVVVIAAPNGWVRLNANIDANARGFRGGLRQDMVSGCNCANFATQYTTYFYPAGSWQGALKGEGIAQSTTGMEAGRGKQGNGGGGGNDHNSGGAGGANYGNGGNGGNAQASSCFFGSYCRGLNAGVAGLGLSSTYYSNAEGRLFLGGGGGAGHYGNATIGTGGIGGNGEAGGGIVVIWADSVNGNGFSILSNGNNAVVNSADGGGGGGAGGTILLDVRSFSPAVLNVSARGGDGSTQNWSGGINNCKGTGGGGGVVWFRSPMIPPTISPVVNGGAAGIGVGTNCAGLGTSGATAGAAGATLLSFSRPFASVGFGSCILPIELSYLDVERSGTSAISVQWKTTSEINNATFDIERAIDQGNFESIGRVASKSMNGNGATYDWRDNAPGQGLNWYRLRQTDLDGRNSVTAAVSIRFDGPQVVAIKAVYPNPVNAPAELVLELNSPTV